ncbi:helix-turn-helix transcriptional regulator [Ectobacillus ponti]|uniref:Winged helix-turn-helix transcriptional regulator n=1 Tax=Ectobacillus ponti TaxID=2961894 RepID=A0AA42BRR0_9BACI|nr:winged helix-turn-helix transcriptional regulator [Ectobacillus ponti]MCP8969759.1 winged helix-turn-helix transcriptional regulator [Ectobacillus ponti]
MDMNTRSTKEEILSLLKAKKQMTVTELARELGVTEMAVRRHISKLEKDEYIQATLVRQHIGRPTYVYTLSAKGEDIFPKQYKDFAMEMLESLSDLGHANLVEQLLKARTDRMKELLEQRLLDKPTTFSRLAEVIAAQQQNGYMAHMELESQGNFIMKKQNCPLLSVAEKFPALCDNEVDMYQELLPDTEVALISCVSGGDCACTYRITEKTL